MSTLRYHVAFVVPNNNPFALGVREVAETLVFGLRRSGRPANLAVNRLDPGAVNIVLNPHLVGEDAAPALPAGTILCNFEQLGGDSPMIRPVYADLVRRHVTWDYSRRNVEAWRRYVPGVRVLHVPVGYAPELTRIARAPEDIDVLFYGAMNERRERILKALEARGVRVVGARGAFGPERDALIARAKVVLNVHFYENKIFEMPRVAYLLANRKAVVSELDADTDIEDDLRDAVAGAPYAALVDRCLALLADEGARRELAERGHAAFSQRSEERLLDAALTAQVAPSSAQTVSLPTKLNAGSGKSWRIDCLNIDVDPLWRPDLVADLGRPLPSSEPVDMGRFGRATLPANHFEEIHASHVLEHVPDLVTAMTSFLALLREGGTLHVEVPYDLSYGAWQDPTHVRAMNERSWLYYTDWFWYLGWREHRFEVVELRYILSDLGDKLAPGMPTEDLLRQPRAVDAMRVILRKVKLTDDDRARVANRWA